MYGGAVDDFLGYYEEKGHVVEMMQLLENGMGLERAHIGMYTELGCLYAKCVACLSSDYLSHV